MKANELRIGNYVSDIHSKSAFWKVRNISNHKLKYGNKKNPFVSRYDNIKPIPLTEEWLLKFEFELDGYYFKSMDFGVRKYKNHFGFFYMLKYNGQMINITLSDIKHVHQLQNLYFALTGKELI